MSLNKYFLIITLYIYHFLLIFPRYNYGFTRANLIRVTCVYIRRSSSAAGSRTQNEATQEEPHCGKKGSWPAQRERERERESTSEVDLFCSEDQFGSCVFIISSVVRPSIVFFIRWVMLAHWDCSSLHSFGCSFSSPLLLKVWPLSSISLVSSAILVYFQLILCLMYKPTQSTTG